MRDAPLAGITGAALLLALGLAACGGGREPLTMVQYFQAIVDFESQFNERAETLFAPLEEAEDPTQAFDLSKGIVPEQAGLYQDFRDGLARLKPPLEAEELHREALAAFDEIIALTNDVVDQLDDIEALEELDALFEADEFVAAEERLTQVCLDAEQLANENAITIDLACDEQ